MNDIRVPSMIRATPAIDDNGFHAILRPKPQDIGVIGRPQVLPTASGLSIEDADPAAIDTLLAAIVKDFGRKALAAA